MGFLERLREEKEVKDAAACEALERERLVQERRKETHDQRRQQEEEEKRRHEESNLHAKQFQEESGIIPLAKEMERLLGGGRGWKGGNPDYRLRDGDSVAFSVTWGWHFNSSREVSGSGKYFAIETCPDGAIVFHASWLGSSSVSQEKWRNNKKLLEVALERAYNRPRIHSWRYYSPSDLSYNGDRGT